MRVQFDHFYAYDELTATLESWATERPALFSFESIGHSYEGRDIWLCTVTNAETGPHDEKPAVFVHAQIHAMEFTGTTAALNLLDDLLHSDEARVRHAVDTRTFYVVPRVNPDGAELALADPPTYLRSSTRRWPRTDEAPGLVEGDIDGDNRILSMRVQDHNGPWVACTADPRLLVARAPDDFGAGPYYRLLIEGEIREREQARAGLPVFQSHGRQDPILPFQMAERLKDVFTETGSPPVWTPFDGPHTIPMAVFRKLAGFLAERLP